MDPNDVTALSSAERAALDCIDPASLVADLCELIEVPSVSGSDAESEIQHLLAKRLDHLDLDVDLWRLDLDRLTAHEDFPGWEAERDESWGLVGASGPGTPALTLQGHVDVVPAGDPGRWSCDPFQPVVRGDLVLGRGTCDMKAGVTANLGAVRALRAARIRLARPFSLQLVVGEEDGGLGAFATLQRGHTADACIITEPTSGTLTTANAGALTFEIAVAGLATHASTAYAGVSAIDVYLPLHAALAELQDRRNADPDPLMAEYPVAYPISVGRLTSGDWASSVPDLLVAEGRLGVMIDEHPQAARDQLEETVAVAAARSPWLRDHPPVVRWTGGQFGSGRLLAGSGLDDLVAAAHADATGGARPRERGAPYGSDLRLYAAAGVPTVHYGPGDVRLAHGPQEAVSVSELVTTTQTLVLALIRSCGVRA